MYTQTYTSDKFTFDSFRNLYTTTLSCLKGMNVNKHMIIKSIITREEAQFIPMSVVYDPYLVKVKIVDYWEFRSVDLIYTLRIYNI